MSDVKEILSLLDNPSQKDRELVERAYEFAKESHEEHTRYSGEPYFNHVFETAKGLAKIGAEPTTVAAGLLHDTIEDVGVAPEIIEKKFGKEILFLVDGVTKLGKLRYRGVERHTESLRKLFVATSQDVRVVIIKLMDRRHNMMTLEHVPAEKQKRIALETLEIYVPIADRLGMGSVKQELEDLAFPYVYPSESKQVQRLLKQKKAENEKHLLKIIKQVKKELGKNNITKFHIEQRVKGDYSLFRKLERKDFDILKIHDISAIRIIVPTLDECYRVLGIIHGMWRPLPGKIKDYIAFPKPNGYQSIHTTVFTGATGTVEIQIRTEQMHHEALYGIASHLTYKAHQRGERGIGLDWIRQFIPRFNNKQNTKRTRTRSRFSRSDIPEWIKQIAEDQKLSDEMKEEYLSEIKSDFFSRRVFAFTPLGDVIDLPIDSSPIDFAYAIHSDIGNHVAGAKVNGKMAALNTKLQNGDIVEVLTKEKSKPSPKWLQFAKTALAKRHIRNALGEQTLY